MSDLSSQLQSQLVPALTDMAEGAADRFVGGLQGILEDADANARAKVEALIRKGFEYKHKAMTASTQEEAREYAEAVETTVRRVRTILLGEKLVAEESVAATISGLFDSALSGLGEIVKGVLSTVASGLLKGAIAGFTRSEGGDSFDPSSLFPFS